MAVCTQCGAIMHNDDAKNHVCNPSAIPQKGKEKIPTTTEKVL